MGKKWLEVPFPLRPDFVVTIEIPRDPPFTSREAERMAEFLKTLVVQTEAP